MKQTLKNLEVKPVFSYLGYTDKYVVFNVTKGNFAKAASNPIYLKSILSVMDTLEIDEIYMPKNVNGSNVVSVDENWKLNQFSFCDTEFYSKDVKIYTPREDSDAIISSEGKFLAFPSADSMAAVIIDEKTDIIAIVHAGWRGALEDIFIKTIDKILLMGNSKKENIKIFIGPSLKKENFEIKEDIKEKLEAYCKKHNLKLEKYIEEKDKYNWLFDLDSLIKDLLIKYGILKENLSISKVDTFSELNPSGEYLYHSYRRDREYSGRDLVGIVSKKYYENVLKKNH